MALAGFLFLLVLTAVDGDSSGNLCSYQHVLNHLNLTKGNELFFMTRPVKNHSQPTEVRMEVYLKAILDVRETDQMFVSDVWMSLNWDNDHIYWEPDDFCGIRSVTVPAEALWKPDIIIEETREMGSISPGYLTIESSGVVTSLNKKLQLVSTCRMVVYKFPFDKQECTLSFTPGIYTRADIKLVNLWESSHITKWSRDFISDHSEWFLITMTVTNKTVNIFTEQDVIVYTIIMKRRSTLFNVNFLLPIFVFLCLDLASFFISESSGEKLGFKITVLLAVTVMQLILQDILPASSNRIPLIAIYCFGIFSLMLLSLLETILVMYLLEKDSASQDNDTDGDQSLNGDKQGKANVCNYFREMKTCRPCVSVDDVSTDEKPSVAKQGSSSKLIEVSLALEKVSDELVETEKAISKLSSRKEEVKPGYWTRVVKKINKAFITFYITAATVFLASIFSVWFSPEANTE